VAKLLRSIRLPRRERCIGALALRALANPRRIGALPEPGLPSSALDPRAPFPGTVEACKII